MTDDDIPPVLIDLPGFFAPMSDLLTARAELAPPAGASGLERQAYTDKLAELDELIAERVAEPIESAEKLRALLADLSQSAPHAAELSEYYQRMLAAL